MMDIEIDKQWLVKCQDCDFDTIAASAGCAEEYAKDHIEVYEDGNGMPNFGHTVIITEVTVVRRD